MPNVRLAIRLRPLTSRELQGEFSSKTVIEIEKTNSTVSITNIKVPAGGAGDSRTRVRKYAADYCFDSSCEANHPDYATQETIFNCMGREVLGEVAKGGSCCVLAYGESATGKTYSMMGTEPDPGLIPRLCAAIASPTPEEDVEVAVSYLEIYNERVGDLLATEELAPTDRAQQTSGRPYLKKNAHVDLRVREHPTRGPYVQNLSVVKVRGGAALTDLVTRAAARRRTAATRRNLASSRSHALLALSTHHAHLQLADLAGSERSSGGGASPGRLKEGANINRSLVALGNVITALASGGRQERYIPYRDSALTWLLRDAFAGGRTTFVFATVSPSADSYAASAHTLRWAARARLLPPAPAAPVRPAARLAALLAALARAGIVYVPETGHLNYQSKPLTDVKKKEEETAIIIDETIRQTDNDRNACDVKMETGNNDISKSFVTVHSTTSSATSGSLENITRRCSVNNTTTQARNDGDDEIFGPQLQRARSDLKVAPPYRNKRRQYSSYEALSMKPMKTKNIIKSNTESLSDRQKASISGQSCTENTPDNNVHSRRHSKSNIVIQDDKRAEIVASVTQRLYTKLKKTEEMASSKMETFDKKIIEPLSELKICTNARQRLLDISQKALRNRRKIGIPACTQTVSTVVRVKEVGTDVQSDLEPFAIKVESLYKLYQDASSETCPVTPRCKEASVGRKSGSIYNRDISTETDDELNTDKRISFKSCGVMTNGIILAICASTQTDIEPPPRKKKSTFTKYLSLTNDTEAEEVDMIPTAIVNINISQAYPQETESSERSTCPVACNSTASNLNTTPDLLSNHNPSDHDIEVIEIPTTIFKPVLQADQHTEPVSNISVRTSHEIAEQLKQSRTNPELCEEVENENAIGNVKFTCRDNKNDTTIVEGGAVEVGGSVTERGVARCPCVPVDNLYSEPFALSIPSDNNRQQSSLSADDGAKMNVRQTNKVEQEDFSDVDEHLSLPRTTEETIKKESPKDYKEIIMGKNINEYPFNLIISPIKDKRTGTRRKTVTFKRHCSVKESANDNDDVTIKHIGHKIINDSDEFNSETMDEMNFSDSDSSVGNPMASDLHLGDNKYSLHHKSHSIIDKTIYVKPRRFSLAQSFFNQTSYNPVYRSRSAIINKSNTIVIPEQNCAINQDAGTSEDATHVLDFPMKNLYIENSTQPIFQTLSTNVATESVDKLQIPNFSLFQLEKSLLNSCERLEEKVNEHEKFLISLEEKRKKYISRQKMASPRRSIPTSPSAYLKELLEMRRSIVRESKSNVRHSFHGFV